MTIITFQDAAKMCGLTDQTLVTKKAPFYRMKGKFIEKDNQLIEVDKSLISKGRPRKVCIKSEVEDWFRNEIQGLAK